MKILSMLILAKRWTDGMGNTNHSVRVEVNGKEIGYEPFEYGGMNAYIMTALAVLKKNGYCQTLSTVEFLRWTSSFEHCYCVCLDVQRKRDL